MRPQSLYGAGLIGSPYFRSVDTDWTPTLPARRAGAFAFGLADILAPAAHD